LRARALIRTERGRLAILDLDALQEIGMFDRGYLHLRKFVAEPTHPCE
jgi:hypothetical protein